MTLSGILTSGTIASMAEGSDRPGTKSPSAPALRYRNAGADGLFVPGLSEPSAIEAIVPEVKMPLNVMAYLGLPSAKELKKLGVRRLSSGTGIPQTIWSSVAELANGFLTTGDSKPLFKTSMPYGKLQ